MNMTREKTKKFRGSMTHGRGKKGGRGAGLRGGRGNAGLSKHRIMHLTKYMPDHSFGKHGFKRPQKMISKDTIINIGRLEEKFPEKTTINLTEEGYDKLLGGGSVSKSYTITVKQASGKAIDKIKNNGGEVTIVE
jgi:large subunit ribosomal protein L15